MWAQTELRSTHISIRVANARELLRAPYQLAWLQAMISEEHVEGIGEFSHAFEAQHRAAI